MRKTLALASLLTLVACESSSNDDTTIPGVDSGLPVVTQPEGGSNVDAGGEQDAGNPSDAGSDAGPGACSVTSAFTATVVVGAQAKSATLTPDELELVNADSDGILHHGRRATLTEPFVFTSLTVNTPGPIKSSVAMTADGLTLYVTARTPGAAAPGQVTLYKVTRAARTDEFGATPTALPLAQSATGDFPTISLRSDETGIYLTDSIGGGIRLRQSELPNGTLANVQTVLVDPQPTFVRGGTPTKNGLALYTSLLDTIVGAGGPQTGSGTLALATRASLANKFDTPQRITVPAHVTGTDDTPHWVSPDNCRLYYSHGLELTVATRSP